MKKRLAAYFLTSVLAVSMLSGCGSTADHGNTSDITAEKNVTQEAADGGEADASAASSGQDAAGTSEGEAAQAASESAASDAEGSETGDSASSSADASKADAANADVTVDQQVLVDQDGVKVTLTGMDLDGFWGPEFDLTVENSGSQNLMVVAEDVSVNGVMTNPAFGSEVAAGKTANEKMNIFSSDLEKAGIETLQTVELSFRAFDSGSYEDVFKTDLITISTSAAGTFEQTYNTDGTELYNANNVRIIAQRLDSEDSFWGADIYLYIENNTDKKIMVTADNVSVNGVMVDPAFGDEIMPGKKAFTTMTFLESDLEANGITSIDSMELSFHIFDYDSLTDIDTTGPITVTFN